ncbi:MAG: hypothetical protein LBP51_05615 [Deferribacteraceae bacterium]|jgi:hypothetical protein|nr:hypothetical protein [Deferribacteraceae bacterium]
MVKMFFAHTMEVDEPQTAVDEIFEQINPNALLKNSVGILSFHSEFVKNNIVEAVSKSYPFDLVGFNTPSSSVPLNYGEFILTLTVLTSDDVSFAAGLSEPLTDGGQYSALSTLYNECSAKLPSKPSFIFSFLPSIAKINGETIINDLDRASGGVANFGVVSYNIGIGINNSIVTFGGLSCSDRVALILMAGDVRPRYTLNFPNRFRIVKDSVFITKSEGHILTEINATPAAEFFYQLGIFEKGDYTGQFSVMLLVEDPEFTEPIYAALLGPTDAGGFFCGKMLKAGSRVSIAAIDKQSTLSFTREAAAMLNKRVNGVIIFSCVAYYVLLELDALAGIKKVRSAMQDAAYLFAYTCGEICPAATASGGEKNQFHNASIISLSFD